MLPCKAMIPPYVSSFLKLYLTVEQMKSRIHFAARNWSINRHLSNSRRAAPYPLQFARTCQRAPGTFMPRAEDEIATAAIVFLRPALRTRQHLARR